MQTIIAIDFDSIENIIFGGDFNCPLNPAVDKRSGNISPRRSVIAAIEQIQSELDVHDIWRIKISSHLTLWKKRFSKDNFLVETGLRKVVPLDLRYIKNNFRSGYWFRKLQMPLLLPSSDEEWIWKAKEMV